MYLHQPDISQTWDSSYAFSSVQSLSHVRLFVTPWTAARQASLSITNSQSPPKLMSMKSVMPSSHLILCRPLLLLLSIFPSIRVFSNESVLHMRWPKYWSFSFNISPSNEHPGLISFRMDWLLKSWKKRPIITTCIPFSYIQLLKTLCICFLLLSPGRKEWKREGDRNRKIYIINFFLSHWKPCYKHHDPYFIQHVSPKNKNILSPNHSTIISPKKINDGCLLLLGCKCLWDILTKIARKIYTQLVFTSIFNSNLTSQGSTLTFPNPYLQLPSPTIKIIPPHIYVFTQ